MKKLSFLVASLLVAGAATAQNNNQTLVQTGSSHSATVTQAGYNSTAIGVQTGVNNDLTQRQDDGPNNVASSTQVGSNGTVSQTQRDGGGNTAVVLQSGNGNSASQLQRESPGGFGASLNLAIITQAGGVGNTASQDQRGVSNEARIDQLGGSNNIARQVQGSNALGSLDMDALIIQNGGTNQRAYQDQKLDNGVAVIDQEGTGNNLAVQDQTGRIGGASNYAYIDQDDAGGHFATQIQDGTNLRAETRQGLSGNDSYINQSGSNNTANVKQNHP